MIQTFWQGCRSALKHTVLGGLGVLHRLDRKAGKAVLLTFDDGPHPEVTPGVLDRLKEYRARAVFFVVGNRIPRAPALLQRIRDEGHLLGNHSFEHWLDRRPGAWEYVQDVARCQEVVKGLTGHCPRLFRPPLGRLTFGSWAAARMARLQTVHWSVDSGDWQLRKAEDALACAQRLSRSVAARDIVLFHDDNPCVLTVLDVLLPRLLAQGFDLHSFVQQVSSYPQTR